MASGPTDIAKHVAMRSGESIDEMNYTIHQPSAIKTYSRTKTSNAPNTEPQEPTKKKPKTTNMDIQTTHEAADIHPDI